MRLSFKYVLFTFLALGSLKMNGQETKIDPAEAQMNQALMKLESGKFDEGIALIRKAQKLDPKNIRYDYELAYAFYLKKDFDKSTELLNKLIPRSDATGKFYQLLGNIYDELKFPVKALETYRSGLARFPKAGELYYEMGILNLKKKDYGNALYYFEKGIEIDPSYPSNYYRAAKLFLSSNEKVWGMIYGEIYIILNPFNETNKEISKMLYETYLTQVAIIPGGQAKAFFANRVIPDSLAMSDSLAAKTRFAKTIYEAGLEKGFRNESKVDLLSLMRVRKAFVENYFKGDEWKQYPNALFDYHYKLLKAGKMDIYNRWILLQHDRVKFMNWQQDNQEEFKEFVKWLIEHPLDLDDKYKFYRGQYR